MFFVSGFPALVYQLVWQRSLFAIYGINVESVTVVVTAFMLGLGLGSLAGGVISASRRVPLLAAFAGIELCIALFGWFSLDLFEAIGSATLLAPPAVTAALTFAMVLLPTLLMGATLPVLTAHLVRHTQNVGRSVGLLYFVNTMGSAVACFAVALFLMRWLGMRGAVSAAVLLNLLVASAAVIIDQLARRQAAPPSAEASAQGPRDRRFWLAAVLVAMTGFIALSYEILWFRVHSFASGSSAAAFSAMLGAYLLGIALGSLTARRFCSADPGPRSLVALGAFVLAANAAGFAVAPLSARMVTLAPYPVILPLVTIAAGLLGATFPLLCHYGVRPDSRAGSGMSYLYLFNILGSAAGSLLTGFVLMDLLSTAAINLLLALAGVGLAVVLALLARGTQLLAQLGACGAVALVCVAATGVGFSHFYERLQWKSGYKGEAFADVVENRHGVITVTQGGAVYGGGMYDGVFNVNLMDDSNMIVRAFSVGAFHRAPRRVLMIGLASGSWAQVMAHHPAVEHMTIIEINPGYLQLIPQHPEVASLLQNPKVEIVIDDGRRWLNRNPDARFDAIVMNTSFHWRAHMSNLLSVEFLHLLRGHLNPGGVVLYNTTGSPEVQRTACAVFPHVVRVINNVVVSDSPLMPDKQRWRELLLDYRIDGRAVIDTSREDHMAELDKILGLVDTLIEPGFEYYAMEVRSSIVARTQDARIVTDDNMGTEWDLYPGG
ncbi:MAG: fused MFS/spermidine synthase [Planctomycetes bacterium]|nr:fused MFS/spermidine synthase [Planctomycetota bacterium]MCW8136773.1 fused MFS/spermidine synthase [Planctomycetota bacterium]